IVSLLMSLFVAFTIVPILCYGLLSKVNLKSEKNKENISVKVLSRMFKPMIKLALRFPLLILSLIVCLIILSIFLFSNLGSNFLPPFNEGTIQVSSIFPPGTDLSLSAKVGTQIEKRLLEVEDVTIVNRRTGRAELDEHAEGVQTSELLVSMKPDSKRDRDEVINEIREIIKAEYPEVLLNISQPISHRIDVILSGIQAQIAIKIFGDDLSKLRSKAQQVKDICMKVDGVVDLSIEPQDLVPQIQVQLKLDKLKNYQLSVGEVCEMLETAIAGRKVGEILQDQRSFDLVVRLQQDQRQDITTIKDLWIPLPREGRVQITDIAEVFVAAGPYRIFRDNVQRRIAVQMNVQGRTLGEVINDINIGIDNSEIEEPGYFVQYGGQFEAQQSATIIIASLSIGALLVIFFLLMGEFKSISLTIQVLLTIPGALIGSVLILVLAGQEFNIAALAGMIALGGIASRNGILLINHYLHLMTEEGENFSKEMIVRAGLERMVPVLMTAITTGIALVP
ncbi:MAG: efflux RND transporter permease subunit, partial [Planctomycetes bacterium]|nr:efflux RND transporter permease subunit [Planctomycetota bacterium]